MKYRDLWFLALIISGSAAYADNDKLEAAIGGGVGGAVGAVIGEELGDKKGAVIGAGVGAAVGAAIAVDDDDHHDHGDHSADGAKLAGHGHPAYRHCPPGQAKKNRC
jgi:hypothetical protein